VRRVLALGALAVALAGPAAARAQTAVTGARVSITTSALTIGQQRDLIFGTVLPGVPVTVNGRSANAGQFQINGTRNAEIAVTMTLPTQLSTGVWTMPVAFGANSGCWRRQPAQGGCTFWDPSTVLVRRIRNQNPPNDHFFVWIGGTVTPSATQHTGVYWGTITMSVVYTGN